MSHNARPAKEEERPHFFERFAHNVTLWSGSSWAFLSALAVIIVWAIAGPMFGFSETWQLVINTGTTIITFLMVFLIQRAQNKESLAVQLKLNEVLAALRGASNRLISIENLSEEDLHALQHRYDHLIKASRRRPTSAEKANHKAPPKSA